MQKAREKCAARMTQRDQTNHRIWQRNQCQRALDGRIPKQSGQACLSCRRVASWAGFGPSPPPPTVLARCEYGAAWSSRTPSPSPVSVQNMQNCIHVRRFSGGSCRVSLQLRLAGGGRSHERTLLQPNSPLTGKNAGSSAIFGRPNVAVIAVRDSFCQSSGANSRFEGRVEQGIFSILSGNSPASTGSDFPESKPQASPIAQFRGRTIRAKPQPLLLESGAARSLP